MVDSPKNDHWQDVVLTDTGVAPGSYNPANITVGADGRITSAATSAVPIPTVVSVIGDLAAVPTADGKNVTVLDDGFGNEALFVWNTVNVDLGAPLFKWRQLANTSTSVPRFNYRQENSIGSAAGIVAISTPIPDSSIIKEISINIVTAYDGAATILIRDDTGFSYVPNPAINPALPGIYTVSFKGNIDTMISNGSGQLEAVIGGAPTVGDATVFATYINP